MEKPTKDISERLKKALLIRNMKPIELSEKTEIPKSAISHYMSGYAKPKDDRIYLISKALDVSEAWLLGYNVKMERDKEDTEIEVQAKTDKILSEISDRVKEYAIRLAQLSEDEQNGIFNMIDLMTKKEGKE